MTTVSPYISLLLLFAFAGLVGGGLLLASHFLGPSSHNTAKDSTYECGIDPVGNSRHRISVKFYLVAMLFILFDVEVVFLYPWAVLFRESAQAGSGLFLFIEMMVFLGILVIGLLYIYGHNALEWE